MGPKVGRGGGRSKGRGRGISIQVIEAIAGSPLLGFVNWLLRHNIDPMQCRVVPGPVVQLLTDQIK